MARTIRALVAPAETTQTKGMTARSTEAVLAQVDVDKLKASIEELRQDMADLFAARDEAGFRLKTVSVGIEISAQGGVTLIGTLTAGAKAAVTLTFERA
ncbi:hypothetical protein [uncultured Thiodictyon sp.]|uniref:Pepco domain-containing protein n=1 Tax=uncultured Thiodictyon sp. TaxID=1846217 RepID=UPI0025E84221|nr:hypothetical protein [uncultured Thiodictyon sp.]